MERERPAHENDVFSRTHPRMTRLNRAKIFAPYAALRGYEECVAAKEVRYEPRHIPDSEEIGALNRRLARLWERCRNGRLARRNRVTVSVTCFEPCVDPQSDAYGRGGRYRTVTGVVRRVDTERQCLTVGERVIAFRDIREIAGEEFRDLELREEAFREGDL